MSKTKLLTQYDLVQSEFFSDEIDCSFLYDYVSEAYKEDPLIKVLSEDVMYNGERCSRVCLLNPVDDSIHVGAAEFGEMPYTPYEDMRGVNVIFDFCHKSKYQYGEVIFPDVPVAEDGFPDNQHFRPYDGYAVELTFARLGFRLLDPTLGCIKDLGHSFIMYTSRGLTNMEPMTEDSYYITPFKDDLRDKKNVMGMQFNPFHPMSIKMLKTAEWFGNVLKGYYSYRSRLVPFLYDLSDKRYRIYSEDWRQVMTTISGALEVFDLVSWFPSNVMLDLQDRGYHIEPFVIEPLIIYSSPIKYPYAKIGPNCHRVDRGVSSIINVPYSRMEFPVHAESVAYVEITVECTLYPEDSLEYQDRTYKFKGSTLQNDYVFVRVVERDNGIFFRAFRKRTSEDKDKEFQFFFEVQGLSFLSFPRNSWGAIVYPYNCQSLVDIIRAEDFVHEFLPLYINAPETNDLKYELDDSVIYEEKREIKVEESYLYKQLSLQGDTGAQSRIYGSYCHFCKLKVDSGVVFEREGASSWIHETCRMCPCGVTEDVVYVSSLDNFQCKKATLCSYQRECWVCHQRVSYKGLQSSFFVHQECVDCDCGLFVQLKQLKDKVTCKCQLKKNYDIVNSRFKDKRHIVKF